MTAVQDLRSLLRHPRVQQLTGGRSGLIAAALPPFLLLTTHRLVTPAVGEVAALQLGTGLALLAALAMMAQRLRRREPVRQALIGFAFVALGATVALVSGQARGFFLPGILVDALYAVGLTASVLLGRPAAGLVHGRLTRRRTWRADRDLRRRYAWATAVWAGAYALRALVTGTLYRADEPGLLAAAKMALGWPLSVACLLATLAILRGVVPPDRAARA